MYLWKCREREREAKKENSNICKLRKGASRHQRRILIFPHFHTNFVTAVDL